MEDKNKSNSSTAPQASSLVENENKPTAQRGFKIEAFKYSSTIDPETFDQTLKSVTLAISEFYAQGSTSTGMPFEELYRGAYNLVLHGKSEELYSAVEATMTSEVQSLCSSLEAPPTDDAEFLKELLDNWNRHIRAINFTRDILMYLDRTYVPANRKMPIKELGLRLWRGHIARTGIRERLVEAVLKRQGRGEDDVVAGVNKMLMELGEDAPDLFFPGGELQVAGP